MKARHILPLALLALAAQHPAAASSPTYVALGDSYAYGFTTLNDLLTAAQQKNMDVLTGYAGYVKPFAQFLGIPQQNAFNLAIPGEATQSFVSGGNPNIIANLNYQAIPNTGSQLSAFDTLAATLPDINDITIQLGGNDILGAAFLPGNPPAYNVAYLTEPAALQKLQIDEYLQEFYLPVLQGVRAKAPGANIFVLGYFDAFAGLGANDPFNVAAGKGGVSEQIVQDANLEISQEALEIGANFVDLQSAFTGKETQDSNILSPLGDANYPAGFPNYHPNAAGYALIAQQLDQTAVPEPGSYALLALGLPVFGLVARRRKA